MGFIVLKKRDYVAPHPVNHKQQLCGVELIILFRLASKLNSRQGSFPYQAL